MNASDYLQGLIANWINGDAFPAVPGQLKIALSETNPNDDGSGFDETVGGTYARQNITLTAPVTNEANGAVSSNNASIVFSGLPAVTATHVAIFNNTGTNMLFYGPLSAVRAVALGDSISIPVNAVNIALKGKFSQYLGEAVLNWLRGTSMPAAPTEIKLELSTADPLRSGAGLAAPSGSNGYVSQAFEFDVPSFLSGTGTTFANVSPIIFGPANTLSWGAISHAAVFSGANMLIYGPLSTPKSVAVGEGIGFGSGSLSLTIR